MEERRRKEREEGEGKGGMRRVVGRLKSEKGGTRMGGVREVRIGRWERGVKWRKKRKPKKKERKED